jgi:hypothetical protein
MIWRGIGGFAAVVLLGAVAGHLAGNGPDPARSFHLGGAAVTVAGDWHQVDADTLTDGRDRLRVTLGGAALTGTRTARLGGYAAWADGDDRILPTTRGPLTVACRCGDAVRSVSVPGAAILTPAPDLALRLRAPGVLASLDAFRVAERKAWTPTSAARLAAAHRRALDALGPLATPALKTALEQAALAYDTLAQTPSASQADLTRADRSLEAAVASLAHAGPPEVQRAAGTTAGGGVSLPTLLFVLVSALVFSALAPATFRRLRTGRGAPAPGPGPSKACALTQRRKPIAPPPTYGRWNEPPRGPGAAPQDGAPSATASSSTA